MTNTEARKTPEYIHLRRALRDLWEGCVPWTEAIAMIGANDCPSVKKLLRLSWDKWNRTFRASLQ